MTGQQTIEQALALKPSEILDLKVMAGKGYASAVALWLAYGACVAAKGKGVDPMTLAPLFDNLTLKVTVI